MKNQRYYDILKAAGKGFGREGGGADLCFCLLSVLR